MLGKIEAGGEGDDRGWDGWMASQTQCTWVWVNSRSWWWTGRPGVLQSMGLQRVRHDWATELNWALRSKQQERSIFTELFWLKTRIPASMKWHQPSSLGSGFVWNLFVKPGIEDKMTTGVRNQKFPLSSQVALLLHWSPCGWIQMKGNFRLCPSKSPFCT